jgi:cation diffusion facilitator family transporter
MLSMSPQRRTAAVSVAAAAALIALKLVAGLLTNSLGLISEAVHSGTDLVAALLTFFALGVAGRPADASHAWGHGKAEHLSALAEGVILAAASVFVAVHAIQRMADETPARVDATWYAFAVVGIVIAVDATRTVVSLRTARRFGSPALLANAVHFGGDMAGTLAVLAGLVLVRAGYPKADAAAALFVAVLVLVAAGRLGKANVDVLMDRTPAHAERAARTAIERLAPAITLDRLRLREAGGRYFADVVISISPAAALAEGHAAADAVESAVREALPESDVVVHVEPARDADTLAERVLGAALAVPGVREIHNVRIMRTTGRIDVSLHLKLPGDAHLNAAHSVANEVEDSIRSALPEVTDVTTHLEPIDDAVVAEDPAPDDVAAAAAEVRRAVHEVTGKHPREVRFVRTDEGLVAFVAVELAGDPSLVAAHELAGIVRSRLRRDLGELHDVLVHTEPVDAH